MSSRRLPGKVLADLADAPLVVRLLERLALCEGPSLLLATSEEDSDTPLAEAVEAAGYHVFRGPLEDVLGRYAAAAELLDADPVVRITADCPLADPRLIGALLDFHAERLHHEPLLAYTSNIAPPTFPDGLDIEILSRWALDEAAREAIEPYDREHVSPYVSARPDRFPQASYEAPVDRSGARWVVDYADDLEFVRAIYGVLYPELGPGFGEQDVWDLLARRPDIAALEGRAGRNGGSSPLLYGPRSRDLSGRASSLIPGGAQTFSKGPTQFVRGFAPSYLERARGAEVWDVDGNRYVDYPLGLGAVLLGHADARVNEAVAGQLERGAGFSLPHRLEVEVAERIVELVPSAEMVRFAKNGSDVTSAAVRIARAVTGREHVLHCGYHGWHDWHIAGTTRNKGVPASATTLLGSFAYDDPGSLEAALQERDGLVAAVVLEPVGLDEPDEGFLPRVAELTRAAGAVLVFDEVITGFRLAPGGAQERYGVLPDLTCLGKALGNGMPISAIAGRAELMRECEEIFFSTTHGGEALSLAAAGAVLDVIREGEVLPHVWELGARLRDGQNAIIAEAGLDELMEVRGLAPRHAILVADEEEPSGLLARSLLQQELLRRGVLFTGGQFICAAHTDAQIDETLAAFAEACAILAEALAADSVAARLEGDPVQPIFRKP